VRYRPLGRDGRSISAVMLAVSDEPKKPADRTALIFAALEAGVNAFEVHGADTAQTLAIVARAVSQAPRDALVLALRLGPDPRHASQAFSREWIVHAVERTLSAAGLARLDLLTLDLPGPGAFTAEVRRTLKAARESDRVALIGAAGEDRGLDEVLDAPELDVLIAPYNLRSGWPERNRLKRAAQRNLIVIGCDSYPAPAQGRRREDVGGGGRGLFGLGRKTARLEQSGGYAFLDRFNGWTPGELCLSYALTEPSLCSMLVDPTDPHVLQGLAAAAERELPAGVSAQIEMARFAAA
jgi:aryl-alcohol dehydrogenase-like predicted oxidoreductase